MTNLNADLAAMLKTLTEKVEQIDRRTSAIATAPNRYYLDDPQTAPKSDPPSRRRVAREDRPKPIADQILDLVQDEPRSGPELSELIGSPRSSINQAVHALVDQRKAFVLQNGRGRGAMSFVFPKGFKNPEEWLFRKLGWERVAG
jgi:hypothetical protein